MYNTEGHIHYKKTDIIWKGTYMYSERNPKIPETQSWKYPKVNPKSATNWTFELAWI